MKMKKKKKTCAHKIFTAYAHAVSNVNVSYPKTNTVPIYNPSKSTYIAHFLFPEWCVHDSEFQIYVSVKFRMWYIYPNTFL